MLDDDDVDVVIWSWPDGGWKMAIVGLIVVIVIALIVSDNKKDCAAMHCDHGKPMLTSNECYCVEPATAPASGVAPH
jgi:hypothetical protein